MRKRTSAARGLTSGFALSLLLGLSLGAAPAARADEPVADANPANKVPAPVAANPEPAPAARQVIVTTPLVKTLVVTRRYPGKIIDPGLHVIQANVPGIISEVAIQNGQKVKEGDVLFQLDRTKYQAQHDAAQATLRQVEQELAPRKPAAASSDPAPPLTKAQEYQLIEARGKAAHAARELEATTVRAPFDGIIDEVREKPGTPIKVSTKLATLSGPGLAWAKFEVPDIEFSEYSQAAQQTACELHAANAAAPPLPGKIHDVGFGEKLDDDLKIQARFPDPAGSWKIGQPVTVVLRTTLRDAVLLPKRAAQFELGQGTFVYVVGNDGVVRQREVDERYLRDGFFVTRAVQPGEQVIVIGIHQVKAGDKVNGDPRPPEEFLSQTEVVPAK